MQLGDLNSSLLDLLVGMAAPTSEGLPGSSPEAPAFAAQLSAALSAGSALGDARRSGLPSQDDAKSDDPAGDDLPASLVLGEGPSILDLATDLPTAPPSGKAPFEDGPRSTGAPTSAEGSAGRAGPSDSASAAKPSILSVSSSDASTASSVPSAPELSSILAQLPPAGAKTPAAAPPADTTPSSPTVSTELRAVTEIAEPVMARAAGAPGSLLRAEVTTLLERIELRSDSPRETTPSLRARLRPEDLGRSLATHARPSTEAAASRSVAAPLAAMAVATLGGAAAMAASSPSAGQPAPAEASPSLASAPVDPAVEKENSARTEPAPRPSTTSVAPTVVEASGAQGEGDSSRSSSEGDPQPEPDLPPTSAPAPTGDASPTTVAAPIRSADLQMQAQQAVARTVVRMGEDQLLASVRPQTATVQLRPSHLGELRIEVHQTPQRTLEVTLTASVPETQRALEADADDMLESLRSQKLDVGRVTVRADGERPDADPRGRNDFFRNRNPRDASFAQGEGNPDREGGGHSGDGRDPSHADPTDYRYWEAVR